MNKLFVAILILLTPLAAIAGKTECVFPVGMVKQIPPPNSTTVASYQWDSGYNKSSSDHIQTLRILYKNGDVAVIRHTHCSEYVFEINYFRNSLADVLDEKAIATLVAGLYSQYFSAPQKVTFSKSLAETIATTFKQQKFNQEKNFDYGLPRDDADYPNKSLEYAIRYKPMSEDNISDIFSSVTKFYMGIGFRSD